MEGKVKKPLGIQLLPVAYDPVLKPIHQGEHRGHPFLAPEKYLQPLLGPGIPLGDEGEDLCQLP